VSIAPPGGCKPPDAKTPPGTRLWGDLFVQAVFRGVWLKICGTRTVWTRTVWTRTVWTRTVWTRTVWTRTVRTTTVRNIMVLGQGRLIPDPPAECDQLFEREFDHRAGEAPVARAPSVDEYSSPSHAS